MDSEGQRSNFVRTVEDFTCAHCGRAVTGNGYTNHCPACLWSLHVDVVPGDRANECGGRMRPDNAYAKGDGYVIEHVCERCGSRRSVRSVRADDTDVIVQIAKEYAERVMRGR